MTIEQKETLLRSMVSSVLLNQYRYQNQIISRGEWSNKLHKGINSLSQLWNSLSEDEHVFLAMACSEDYPVMKKLLKIVEDTPNVYGGKDD